MAGGTPSRAHGLDSLTDELLHEVVEAVRFELASTRDAIHRLRRVKGCDLHVGVGVGGGLRLSGECLCRDVLVEMLLEADQFLAGRPVERLYNPPGAVRAHIRKRVGDWTRRRRTEMGAQARTDRLRSSVMAARLPDDYHRALLEYLAEEAGSLAPLDGDEALRNRIAELAAAEFGGSAAEHLPRVIAGIAVVAAVCRARRVRVAADSAETVDWWERYIETPLGRRPRTDELSLDAAGPDGTQPLRDRLEAPAPSPDVGPLVVETVLAAVGSPARLPVGLRDAEAELVRRKLLAATAGARFLADPGRLESAAEQVRVLLAA